MKKATMFRKLRVMQLEIWTNIYFWVVQGQKFEEKSISNLKQD
jgi:hypothetical protein